MIARTFFHHASFTYGSVAIGHESSHVAIVWHTCLIHTWDQRMRRLTAWEYYLSILICVLECVFASEARGTGGMGVV